MTSLYACWECGRAAPSGVCMGPHEGFSLRAAVTRGQVAATGGDGLAAWANQQVEDLLARMEVVGVPDQEGGPAPGPWTKRPGTLQNLRSHVRRLERERRAS